MTAKQKEAGAAPTWEEMRFGNIYPHAATSRRYRTGDWRSERPVIDREKCTNCGMCWLYCPEPAIVAKDDGSYEVDLYYCKGCGICTTICPRKCITMEEEET